MPFITTLSHATEWAADETKELADFHASMERLVKKLGCLATAWHAIVERGKLKFYVVNREVAQSLKNELSNKLDIVFEDLSSTKTLAHFPDHFFYRAEFDKLIVVEITQIKGNIA